MCVIPAMRAGRISIHARVGGETAKICETSESAGDSREVLRYCCKFSMTPYDTSVCFMSPKKIRHWHSF